jgi:hypothetical protein
MAASLAVPARSGRTIGHFTQRRNGKIQLGCFMESQARSSFSRKRSKKLLSVLSRTYPDRSATALVKAFWSFFSKKDCLLSMRHGQGD